MICNLTTLGVVAPLGYNGLLILSCTFYAFKVLQEYISLFLTDLPMQPGDCYHYFNFLIICFYPNVPCIIIFCFSFFFFFFFLELFNIVTSVNVIRTLHHRLIQSTPKLFKERRNLDGFYKKLIIALYICVLSL